MHDQGRQQGRAPISKAVYGLVTLMAVLTGMEDHPPEAWRGAVTLFGTTLAVALIDAYAETNAGIIARGRGLPRAELREIARDVAPVLVGAQAPTFVFLLSALGLFPVERAISIAQLV